MGNLHIGLKMFYLFKKSIRNGFKMISCYCSFPQKQKSSWNLSNPNRFVSPEKLFGHVSKLFNFQGPKFAKTLNISNMDKNIVDKSLVYSFMI